MKRSELKQIIKEEILKLREANIDPKKIVAYTNDRLKQWYKTAKTDYGVNGSGVASFNKAKNTIDINYKENGKSFKYSVAGFEEEAIDYVFNVWSEQADK